MKNSCNNVIVTLYSHPEYYPPTLNLITELSFKFDNIAVVSRNVLKSTWLYPSNVKLYFIGKYIPIRQTEKANILLKSFSFLRYTLRLLIVYFKVRPKYIILCDAIPTVSFFLIKFFISKDVKIWYHNHDVLEPRLIRNYSLNYLASIAERKIFRFLNIFTLPSTERKSYFPLGNFNGNFYFLPNYPSKNFFLKFHGANLDSDKIKIIFQGEISAGHGIEEVIKILSREVNGKSLELWLAGNISDCYRETLNALAIEFHCVCHLKFVGFLFYKDLPILTQSCHIGLACYSNIGIMNQTIATASNKIYEYSALKLPVISNFSELSNSYLSQFEWCKLVELNDGGLLNAIKYIDKNYQYLSNRAHFDFIENLNFQYNFNKIKLDM
jgi:hypothetical protein